jgi:hypothetical protein
MNDPELLKAHTDTPAFPGTDWQVHGPQRPLPPVVTPGRLSSQDRPSELPSDAIVLYDGSKASIEANWEMVKGGPVQWNVGEGYIEVTGEKDRHGSIRTKRELGDGQYHIEWTAPTEIKSSSQGRGNSGVFLLGLYEVQVLDCYQNPTYADGTVGGIYGQIPPLVNAIRKPGEWNTYDIAFVAPRFDGDKLISPAKVTLFFNGIYVHNAVELLGGTTFRALPEYKAHPLVGPLILQDHWDKVRYRQVWYRPLGQYDAGRPESPVKSALYRG